MDKHRFFVAAERRKGTYTMPGFGDVTIQQLTMADRVSIPERVEKDGQARTSAWAICQSVEGLSEEDIESVMQMDQAIIEEMVVAIIGLSEATSKDVAEAKNG